jgi:hypothetical protein
MKYLHDNGFRVLTLSHLGHDPINNVFYIKNGSSSGSTTTAATIATDSPSTTSNTK